MLIKFTILLALLLSSMRSFTQPYIDIIDTHYFYSPDIGLSGSGGQSVKLSYSNISSTIPFLFKKTKDAIILSPSFEEWNLTQVNRTGVRSMILPLGYFKNISNNKWSVLSMVIARINKEVGASTEGNYQWGGVIIVSNKRSTRLTVKAGLYYNREFFGNFLVPLAGIDWEIDVKNNLFGVLPGSMTFEHKKNESIYYGAAFRAITNSYRLHAVDPCFTDCTLREYLRIDDNQLGFFADYYFTKNFLLNVEVGHTIFREIWHGRIGEKIGHERTILADKDNFYLRAGLVFRVRTR